MTANQLVAYNLKRAREYLNLTQEAAAQRIRPYSGKPWSIASLSDAERSAENGRTREFDANELLAFALAFGRPIAWFFEPPDDVKHVYAGAPLDVSRTVSRAELLEAVRGVTLWDQIVLREQVKKLRDAADALEAVERQSEERGAEAARGGTVGVAQNVSDEEFRELREEEDDG